MPILRHFHIRFEFLTFDQVELMNLKDEYFLILPKIAMR